MQRMSRGLIVRFTGCSSTFSETLVPPKLDDPLEEELVTPLQAVSSVDSLLVAMYSRLKVHCTLVYFFGWHYEYILSHLLGKSLD